MSNEQNYKEHTIRITPHKEYCSEYSFVIISPRGEEIKHVSSGGVTLDNALEKAKQMIDFELELQEEQT